MEQRLCFTYAPTEITQPVGMQSLAVLTIVLHKFDKNFRHALSRILRSPPALNVKGDQTLFIQA
jgi:hypothetical protein